MSGNNPIILLYHQVSPEDTKFIENYNINVKPKLFDEIPVLNLAKRVELSPKDIAPLKSKCCGIDADT